MGDVISEKLGGFFRRREKISRMSARGEARNYTSRWKSRATSWVEVVFCFVFFIPMNDGCESLFFFCIYLSEAEHNVHFTSQQQASK